MCNITPKYRLSNRGVSSNETLQSQLWHHSCQRWTKKRTQSFCSCLCKCLSMNRLSESFLHSLISLIHLILLHIITTSDLLFLTFPQLLISTGKEQRRKMPSERSSSPKLFTLKALGSSKASVAERGLDFVAAAILGAAVPCSLSNKRWGSEGRKPEYIITPLEVSTCAIVYVAIPACRGNLDYLKCLYKFSFFVISKFLPSAQKLLYLRWFKKKYNNPESEKHFQSVSGQLRKKWWFHHVRKIWINYSKSNIAVWNWQKNCKRNESIEAPYPPS